MYVCRRREKEKKEKKKEKKKGKENEIKRQKEYKCVCVCVCVCAREERNLRQDCGEKEIPGGFFPSCLGRRAAAGWLSGPSYQGNSTEHTE